MNDYNPLVTIIICFYNEETFLNETIQSVLKQTYQNWEMILIDDGSINNSTYIAKNYADLYSDKIKYYDHPGHVNKGISASRNRGIQKANGELIAFLDADDIFLPRYLENQINIFNSTDAVMICEATEYWYSWTNIKSDDVIKQVGAPQDQLYKPRELNQILYPLKKAAAPCMCGIIILKEKLVYHGGFEDSFTGLYEDQVFLTKIYYNEHVYISSSCNNRYRQRPDSLMMTARNKADYIRFRTQYLEWFKKYLENAGNFNQNVYSLLKKNMLPYKHPRYHLLFYIYPQRILNKIKRIFHYVS